MPPVRRAGSFSSLLLTMCACGGGDDGPPPCGSADYDFAALVPGPGEAGHDAQLASLATLYDRQFAAFNAHATGLNADLDVVDTPEARAAIDSFLKDGSGLDFEAHAGAAATTVIRRWQKSAGLYAGVGVAADAYRYGTLRDQGAACADVDAAREQLLVALAGMHLAQDITGTPGVIARSLSRLDVGEGVEVVPLFDENGAPLPAEKNNGTWRADVSGRHPDYVWEDSLSRDMLVGWAMAFGAGWEVIGNDSTIPDQVKATLRADAEAIGRALMVVRESGYDLEVPDADGRTTFHGYLNENNVDRLYVDGAENGFHTVMALGIVGALAYASGAEDLQRYLDDDLVARRRFATFAARDLLVVNLGVGSNFSNFNMAYTGIWLAFRYVKDERARAELRISVRDELYDKKSVGGRQPVEMKQSFFDFIYAAGMADARPDALSTRPVDGEAVARGVQTLNEFAAPPAYETLVINCDEQEIEAGVCTCEDGTVLNLLGDRGRGDKLVSVEPVPMRTRPSSNFHWRSNPYVVNGEGDGGRLLPGVDFRVAYWMGRWVRVAD